MVVRRTFESSSEDSAGEWRTMVDRRVAVDTLAAVRRRFGGADTPDASLDVLRRNLQAAVTRDIDGVVKKYLEKFFVPAVDNIRSNLGEDSVGEDHLRAVCRAMLDGARALYAAPRDLSVDLSDSESSNSPSRVNRKERRKRRADPSSRKWDPARLTPDTLFIMGSVANKVLGLGHSRGRLYSKHAGLLRYPADSADKEWISNQNFKTSSGGRTYIMVLRDIEELIASEDYRNSPALRLGELSCFRAPPFMLKKIRAYLGGEDTSTPTPTPTPPPPVKDEPTDADMDLLAGDYCSYAQSEPDMKRSFDRISDDSGDIFLTGENPSLPPFCAPHTPDRRPSPSSLAFSVPTPSRRPPGNVLHNAIVSRNMVNRGLNAARPSEDDTSITTTKAMIDNTCNSSAMLKQVLTLGSAGVHRTFLVPSAQKSNAPRPVGTSSASSSLSASHATLTALLSGADPSGPQKKGPLSIKEEK